MSSYIEDVSTVLGNQAVHERHAGIQTHETAGQGRTNEAQAASDEDVLPGKFLVIVIHHEILLNSLRTVKILFFKSLPAAPEQGCPVRRIYRPGFNVCKYCV